VDSITSLSSIEATDGYVLTDKLTPRQFPEMIDLDIDTTKLLYSVYAAENEDYSKLITNMSDYSVPIIDALYRQIHIHQHAGVILPGELFLCGIQLGVQIVYCIAKLAVQLDISVFLQYG